MANLHRKNAAEWIMVWALAPLRGVFWLFRKKCPVAVPPPADKKTKRSVMIEGLPPRTMN
jgi:hypothetical protein